MDKLRTGNLVSVEGPFSDSGLIGVIINGPYPSTFVTEEDGIRISSESLAVDIISSGKIYKKIDCKFISKF